jgi:hypothetical protein
MPHISRMYAVRGVDMNFEDLANEIRSQYIKPEDAELAVQMFEKILGEIRSAQIILKKLRILRNPPIGVYDNLNLIKRGPRGRVIAFGDPMVFVKIGDNTIKARHRHLASPFQTKFNVVCDNVWYVTFQTNKLVLHDLLIEHVSNQYVHNEDISYNVRKLFGCVVNTDAVAGWLHENCPELSKLDVKIKASWEHQERKFEEVVQEHLDRSLPKHKKSFCDKLFKHLISHNAGAFAGVPPKQMMQMFMIGAKNPDVFREFARFCHRNTSSSSSSIHRAWEGHDAASSH